MQWIIEIQILYKVSPELCNSRGASKIPSYSPRYDSVGWKDADKRVFVTLYPGDSNISSSQERHWQEVLTARLNMSARV